MFQCIHEAHQGAMFFFSVLNDTVLLWNFKVSMLKKNRNGIKGN